MRPGYKYDATGEGVRDDLVSAVLIGWAGIDPAGDPSGPLRNVGDGYINHVGNLARIAALAVALHLERGHSVTAEIDLAAQGETRTSAVLDDAIANLASGGIIRLTEDGRCVALLIPPDTGPDGR
jgi:hypothetical protein